MEEIKYSENIQEEKGESERYSPKEKGDRYEISATIVEKEEGIKRYFIMVQMCLSLV